MKNIFLTVLFLLIFTGCGVSERTYRDPAIVSIKGSDTMVLLVQRLAEEFMRRHPGVSITVEGGGSANGIEALIDSDADMCATSRPLTADEVRQLASRHGSLGISLPVAKDALAIVVHPSNPVRTLTAEEIRKVFTGAITEWKEIGGEDRPIAVYRREDNSGSNLYFEEHLLFGEAYSGNSIQIAGPSGLIAAVLSDSSAISYSPVVFVRSVKTVPINGIVLSEENVRNGRYPVSRYLYFYVVHPPEGTVKRFLDWTIGKEGQQVVLENGYIPLFRYE